MFSTIRDLYYLASEAAYIPVRLAQALGEGIALGWRVANAQDGGTMITRNWPADAEADQEVWEPQWAFNDDGGITFRGHNDFGPKETSPPDDVVSADSAGGERPSANSGILPPVAEGHPTSDIDRTLYAGAVGLRMWIRGEPCTAPTYFKSIAADLDTLSK